MGNYIEVVDISTTGEVFDSLLVQLSAEHMTVRQLIEERVIAEVEKVNKTCDKNNAGKSVDLDSQIETALSEYESNGFFILVDSVQVESLETVLLITETTSISFVRLVPIVGG